jgi:hypothetical protein
MPMNEEEKRLTKMLEDVFATQESEIYCDAASTQMIQSAQMQLSDEKSQQRFPELWHHFRVCSDCQEEYRMMHDMIHLEETGQLEYPQVIPPVPDRQHSPRWSLQDAISRIFPGFPPSLASALARGEDLGVEPAEIALEDQVRLELDVGIHETNQDLRDLFGNVLTDNERLEARLEGTPIWLQLEADGPIIQEEALDEFGDFSFTGIAPGQYALRLQITGKMFIVSDINVP